MFDWASLVMPVAVTVSVVVSFHAYLTSSEKRHKLTLDFERKKNQEDLEGQLLKARIYADKDRDIARLETSVLSGMEAQPPEDMSSIVSSLLQNPEMLSGILEKIKSN